MYYPVACECGKDVLAQSADAGSRVKCGCGREVEVPSLSELRRRETGGWRRREAPSLDEIAERRLEAGDNLAEVEAALLKQGMDEPTARKLAADKHLQRARAFDAAARRNIGLGAMWLVGGLAVTAGTICMAGSGGTYILAWGAIIGGAVQLLRGLTQLNGTPK